MTPEPPATKENEMSTTEPAPMTQEQTEATLMPYVPEGEITLERVLAIIHVVDRWLDSEVAPDYQAQPLAQDWARVTKAGEEVGEAIEALIGFTGQNPRKGTYGSLDDLLKELGDIAVTGIFAIQHFTKDNVRTASVIMAALEKAAGRAAEAGYGVAAP